MTFVGFDFTKKLDSDRQQGIQAIEEDQDLFGCLTSHLLLDGQDRLEDFPAFDALKEPTIPVGNVTAT